MINQNSVEAYLDIKAGMSPRQALVYSVINRHGLITRHDVADILGIDLYKISGRFTEILAKGQIIEYGNQVVDGRKRALLCINPDFQLEVAA